MNIKEHLEKYIEKESKIDSMRISGPIPLNAKGFEIGFQRGANEMKELLLIAVDALEGISKAKCSGADVYSFADAAKFDAIETLKEIQEKIKGE